MRQFFKIVFGTMVGIILLFIIFILLLLAMVPGKEETPENAVLKIDLNKRIEEREEHSLFSKLGPVLGGREGTVGLLELRKAIAKAKEDDHIKGIVLNFGAVPAGFATMEELRNSILDFKKSGKFVTAYAESYTEGNYYVASTADKIYLPESGLVELNGLSVELLFFKGTLDKLEIKPEVFPVGKFKSAVEPFRFEKMSDANRTQIQSYLGSLYSHYLSNVSKARGVDTAQLRNISDSMLVRTAEDALKFKLITNVGYYDEMLDFVRGKLGIEKDKKIHFVKPDTYYDALDDKKLGSSNKVAVIFASGTITDGKGTRETIGSASMAAEIRKARLDDDVKAVVLRINSPGGSALASDVMWREIMLTSKKKPIIASMSDVAASGGYYMAMGCSKIVAQPNTITGSIGVFGLLFNGENFLKNKLGVTTDREKTGQFSDVGSFTRQLSAYERNEIQREVERIYIEFKRKAALGRKTDTATIEKYAQGRVWTGIEAKSNGLVDVLGGLDDAVKLAAESAKLGTEYTVDYLPEETDLLFGKFMEDMDSQAQLSAQEQMSTYYPYFKALTELEKMKGIQARLPYEIIIK